VSKYGKLQASNVVWNYRASNAIGGNGEPMRTNRATIRIQCVCGHQWTAANERVPGRPGTFHEFLGGVAATCPRCGESDQFTDKEVM
jgi:hypothetical protein